MCSVLIFTKPDNEHEDPAQDWKRFKAGDVIDISEFDNFYWGDDIQGPNALGWWSVVVVPRAQKAQIAYLLEAGALPLVSLEPLNTAEVPHQKRLWTIDLNMLAPEMSLAELSAAVSAKPAMSSMNVIG